jgi:hypothetical protein
MVIFFSFFFIVFGVKMIFDEQKSIFFSQKGGERVKGVL